MGWLRSVRFQKKRAFAQLDDGSGGVQLLLRPDTTAGFDGLRAQLSTGASVRVRGSLQASPAAGQAWELVATDVELVGGCGEGYPLQKKWHSPEFLRSVPHLRVCTLSQLACDALAPPPNGDDGDACTPLTSFY